MVNTFLVHEDFHESARRLDNRRLGKQRVEAWQIYNDLLDYHALAKYFSLDPFPVEQDTTIEERKTWMTTVVSCFKQSGIKYLVFQGDQIFPVYRKDDLPIYIKIGQKFTVKDNLVTIGKETKSRFDYLLPTDRAIGIGHKYHPAVRMWLGFERALTQYINAHIEVWLERGYTNNLPVYESIKCPRPSWTINKQLFQTTMGILLQREIERKELVWYLTQKPFLEAWLHKPEKAELYVEIFRYGKGLKVSSYLESIKTPLDHLLSKGKSRDALWF